MRVIGISGWGRSGKDSIATFLKQRGFTHYAFADRVREALYQLNPGIGVNVATGEIVRVQEMVNKFGWEETKQHPEVTALLQRMGTEAGRNTIAENVWVLAMEKELLEEQPEAVSISDVRFPNEAEWVHAVGGLVWRVNRMGNQPKTAPDGSVHISETLLDDWPHFDAIINNDSTLEDLKEKVLVLHRATEGGIWIKGGTI